MPELTKTQRNYLDAIHDQYTLQNGWGGYRSIRTLRILEERGFINLMEFGVGRWRAQLTAKGRAEVIR